MSKVLLLSCTLVHSIGTTVRLTKLEVDPLILLLFLGIEKVIMVDVESNPHSDDLSVDICLYYYPLYPKNGNSGRWCVLNGQYF